MAAGLRPSEKKRRRHAKAQREKKGARKRKKRRGSRTKRKRVSPALVFSP